MHCRITSSIFLASPYLLLKTRSVLRFLVMWLLLFTQSSFASIPTFLEPWAQWIGLQQLESDCLQDDQEQRLCDWPGQLKLTIEPNGGGFHLWVAIDASIAVRLPGNSEFWPRDVQIKQRGESQAYPGLIVADSLGSPQTFLKPGEYEIYGIWNWEKRPKSIPLPPNIALVSTKVSKDIVAQHNLEKNQLDLQPKELTKQANSKGSVQIEVYRELVDTVPQQLNTVVKLTVSGKEQTFRVNGIDLPNTHQIKFNSPLPARKANAGGYEVKASPGLYVLRVQSRWIQPQLQFAAQPGLGIDKTALWPDFEIWAFRSRPKMQQVQIIGQSIDGNTTNQPTLWRHLPTYVLTKNQPLRIEPIEEGSSSTAQPQLQLSQDLWIDLDGQNFITVDSIHGQANGLTRLEGQLGLELQRVSNGATQLPITRRDPDKSTRQGVELRDPKVELTAVGLTSIKTTQFASHWRANFDRVRSSLTLPPGWLLLAVNGDLGTSSAWLNQWTIWDIFIGLGGIVLCFYCIGLVGAVLLGMLTVLIFQSLPELIFGISGLLLVFLSIKHQAGQVGQILGLIGILIGLSLGIKGLIFSAEQIKFTIYPQLAAEFQQNHILSESKHEAGLQNMAQDAVIERSNKAKLSVRNAYSSSSIAKTMQSDSIVITKPRTTSSFRSALPQLEKIQTGRSAPEWQGRQHQLYALGPVQMDKTIKIQLLRPWQTALWNITSVILFWVILLIVFVQNKTLVHKRVNVRLLLSPSITAILLLGVISVWPTASVAADTIAIDQKTYEDLARYLNKKPLCFPKCSSIETGNLIIADNELTWTLIAHAQSRALVYLPNSPEWEPEHITIDGQPAYWHLRRQTHTAQLAIEIMPGQHSIELQGPINASTINFKIPMIIHNSTVHAAEWSSFPASPQYPLKSSLALQQMALPNTAQRFNANHNITNSEILGSPYLQIERRLRLDVDWQLTTTVRRMNLTQTQINLELPLWPGEQPLENLELDKGIVKLRLKSGQSKLTWKSSVKPQAQLLLKAKRQSLYTENWVIEPSRRWYLQWNPVDALFPILTYNARSSSTKQWLPWPGQAIEVQAQRLTTVDGQSQSIERANLTVEQGAEVDLYTLNLEFINALAGSYKLTLLDGAKLLDAQLDNTPIPISKSLELIAQLKPGKQQLAIRWQRPHQSALKQQLSRFKSSLGITNISIHVIPVTNSWILHVFGPEFGPAVMIWGVAIVLLTLAICMIIIQRFVHFKLPIKPYEWLILAFGMTQLWPFGFGLIAIWIVWIGKIQHEQIISNQAIASIDLVKLYFLALLWQLLRY